MVQAMSTGSPGRKKAQLLHDVEQAKAPKKQAEDMMREAEGRLAAEIGRAHV